MQFGDCAPLQMTPRCLTRRSARSSLATVRVRLTLLTSHTTNSRSRNPMSGGALLRFALVLLPRELDAAARRNLVVRVARDPKTTRGSDFSRRGHPKITANVDCTVHNDDS